MCILTTILVVVSREYRSLCIVKGGLRSKIISPTLNISGKLSVRTNRTQDNNSSTSFVVNTFISDTDASYTTSIFTISINVCASNSTETIAINLNNRRRSISTTSVNNSNGDDTTILYNCLCLSTTTRTQGNVWC